MGSDPLTTVLSTIRLVPRVHGSRINAGELLAAMTIVELILLCFGIERQDNVIGREFRHRG
jgi:hypothetical protein